MYSGAASEQAQQQGITAIARATGLGQSAAGREIGRTGREIGRTGREIGRTGREIGRAGREIGAQVVRGTGAVVSSFVDREIDRRRPANLGRCLEMMGT